MDISKRKIYTNRLVLSSLLFGLFFGAGNLIFPVSLGQNAGASVVVSSIGFIITGVGFTSLAVIACERSKAKSLVEMLSPYGKTYAFIFTSLLLLTIGPMFALPRTATVPYEVAIHALFPEVNHTVGLALFSGIFFGLAYIMALKPNKINVFVGKVINPLFLTCLAVFFVVFIFNSMGGYSNFEAMGGYTSNAFLQGFEDGYQTMDVLAALIFSFVIIGVNSESKSSNSMKHKDIIIASLFAGLMMAFIYTVLALIGASSLNQMGIAVNGGVALGQIFNFYFGNFGSFFLSITITLACLKTAIGLITSCSNFFMNYSSKLNYNRTVTLVTLLAFIVSNFGLNAIIQLALPVLKFLYPLAIMHVFMNLMYKDLSHKQSLIRTVLITTMIASVFEILAMPGVFENLKFSKEWVLIYKTSLPLSSVGLAWVNFTVIGLVLGYLITLIHSPKQSLHHEH